MLEQSKQAAYGSEGIAFAGCSDCVIYPSGKAPLFRWHLQFPDCHLFISRSGHYEGETPNAFVSVSAETLWSYWLKGSLEQIARRLASLGGVIDRVKPSRCDLCADFFLPVRLTLDDLHSRRVPRHYETRPIFSGDDLETWYVGGTKSPIRLRIYDKGREILKQSQKLWFVDVWNRESVDNVWRVEFQLRRSVLRKFCVESLDDLEAKLGGLWGYLTIEWFSLREADGRHTTRRRTASWWQAVQNVSSKFGDVCVLHRRDQMPTADTEWYISHIAGCLKPVAARRGKLTLDQALGELVALLRGKIRPDEFEEAVRVLCIKSGFPVPEDEVNDAETAR